MKNFDVELLTSFRGSDVLYEHNTGLFKTLYTEGIFYLMWEAKCSWLLDYICSSQVDPKIQQEAFQVWELELNKGLWIIACENGNGKTIHINELLITEFPMEKLKIYVCNNTMLLPWEY